MVSVMRIGTSLCFLTGAQRGTASVHGGILAGEEQYTPTYTQLSYRSFHRTRCDGNHMALFRAVVRRADWRQLSLRD
jgi:hypothetical protein